jgi:hypothetical protein
MQQNEEEFFVGTSTVGPHHQSEWSIDTYRDVRTIPHTWFRTTTHFSSHLLI